jgi:hypothetical protein
MTMDKTKMGLYGKFRVERTDGKSAPGEKHEGCRYFVLDLDHDPFALPALRAYERACAARYPALSQDLTLEIARMAMDFGGDPPAPQQENDDGDV